MDIKEELEKAERKKSKLHEYILMKLEEEDYHAIADASMDLREIAARIHVLEELI